MPKDRFIANPVDIFFRLMVIYHLTYDEHSFGGQI